MPKHIADAVYIEHKAPLANCKRGVVYIANSEGIYIVAKGFYGFLIKTFKINANTVNPSSIIKGAV